MGKCKGLREVKEIKTRDRYHGITQWYIWEIKKNQFIQSYKIQMIWESLTPNYTLYHWDIRSAS